MLYVFIYVYWCPTRLPYHMTFVLFNSNTTGVTCGAETINSSRAFDVTPVFSGIRTVRSLVFCVMFCLSLFVLLSFTLTTVCPFVRLCIDHCLSFCQPLHWPLSVLLYVFALTTICPFVCLCIDHCLSFCSSLHWPLSVLFRCTTSDYSFWLRQPFLGASPNNDQYRYYWTPK